MAEMRIRTVYSVKQQTIPAGSSGTSGPIDLRDVSVRGDFGLTYVVTPCGTNATCGTVTFEYLGSPVYAGVYASPVGSLGTFATVGNAGGTAFMSFTPPTVPFLSIKANAGTSNSALVSFDVHCR